MKYTILLLAILLWLPFFAQKAETILKKSFDKCQTVQNGTYEMTHYMKYMDNKDTAKNTFTCSFKKLQDDTLYSSAFHYLTKNEGGLINEVMYTGEDFVTSSSYDSTATIMSKKLWAQDIDAISHNFTFYAPLTNGKNYPLPKAEEYTDNKHIFKYLGEEKINGSSCHHIQVNRKPENDSLEPMKELRIEFQYWIKKKDLIPLQYSITMDLALDGDTMCQHEKYVLHKYDINNLKDQSYLTLNSIPKGYKVKDYEPYERPELLDSATIAPNWELLSLKDEKVSLSSLKGQLVLIDFFYKSCYPCMLAIPGLQALHEKYQDKGLRVIGIDPYDTKEEDDIEAFLAKRGVTYTILIGGKDAAKEYHVSAYPTLYLVDETGNIIHIQEGYSKEAEEELEEIIKKHLKTTTNR